MVIQNEDLKLWSETYQLRSRAPPPYWNDGPSLIRAIDNTIRLVRLVAQIHKAGIVHNSIRPTTVSNSMFNEVHLHDFSCAFHLPTAAHDAADTAPIRERGMREESLPYLAPECSGRVGKTADRLADYYSIGATLFEVFTGQVPFADALDPLEIVHAHIAKRPALMSQVDPSVPHALSLVVAKCVSSSLSLFRFPAQLTVSTRRLLEKSPEARYQTSQGLIVDLERVRDLIPTATTPGLYDTRRGSISAFAGAGPSSPLGRSTSPFTSASTTAGTVGTYNLGALGLENFVVGSLDEAAYFRLPPASQLFGRDESIEQLRNSFERVKQSNKPAVVVVKGHSGIGKTSLIETLRAPAVSSRGHFTSVKFGACPFFSLFFLVSFD